MYRSVHEGPQKIGIEHGMPRSGTLEWKLLLWLDISVLSLRVMQLAKFCMAVQLYHLKIQSQYDFLFLGVMTCAPPLPQFFLALCLATVQARNSGELVILLDTLLCPTPLYSPKQKF